MRYELVIFTDDVKNSFAINLSTESLRFFPKNIEYLFFNIFSHSVVSLADGSFAKSLLSWPLYEITAFLKHSLIMFSIFPAIAVSLFVSIWILNFASIPKSPSRSRASSICKKNLIAFPSASPSYFFSGMIYIFSLSLLAARASFLFASISLSNGIHVYALGNSLLSSDFFKTKAMLFWVSFIFPSTKCFPFFNEAL